MTPPARLHNQDHNRNRDGLTPWLFAAPGLGLLALFLVAPFVLAAWLSFTDQRLISSDALPTAWVGARNYARLLADSSFWAALRNNFLFVAVVAVIWSLLYSPDAGVINRLVGLLSFGSVGPQDWLRDPLLVMPAVMLMSIWQGVGFQMLVFLAGLQAIPADLYEAATLDGATAWKQFRFITLPMLKNTTVFVLVTTTIYAFQLFTQVQIIANSGASAPVNSFRTLVMLMVHEGFRNGKVGYACAVSVVFFVIVLTVSLLQRVLLREDRAAA